MSIRAVAPARASASPAARPRRRVDLAPAQRGGDLRLEAGGQLRALEQEQPGGRAAELAGHGHHVAGARAGAGDELARGGRLADRGHGDDQRRRPGDVAPGHRHTVLGGDLGHAVGELQELGFGARLRHPELDVGLGGRRPHRGQVGERDGERLAAHLAELERRQLEVHPLDQGVDASSPRRPRAP